MKTIRTAIGEALAAAGIDKHQQKATNRVLEALCDNGETTIAFLEQLGVVKKVGYTTVDTRRVRTTPIAKGETVRVYVLRDDLIATTETETN